MYDPREALRRLLDRLPVQYLLEAACGVPPHPAPLVNDRLHTEEVMRRTQGLREPKASVVRTRLLKAVPIYWIEWATGRCYERAKDRFVQDKAVLQRWDEEVHLRLLSYFTRGLEDRVTFHARTLGDPEL